MPAHKKEPPKRPPWWDVLLSLTFYHREAENAMSNEKLVVLIQAGEREYLPQLWAQVERFVAKQASRRMTATGGFGGVEFWDLYDSGYIALVGAVESFDPEAGRSFVGWLALHLCGGRGISEPEAGARPAPPGREPGRTHGGG